MNLSFNDTILIVADLTCAVMFLFIPIYLSATIPSPGSLEGFRGVAVMIALCPVLLITDAGSAFFTGYAGLLAYHGVRISYFLQYLVQYSILALTLDLVLSMLRRQDGNLRAGLLLSSRLLYIALVIILIVAQFTDVFYTFDAQNEFHRFRPFDITTVISILLLAEIFVLCIRNNKSLTLFSLPLLAVIAVILALTTIWQYLLNGTNLVNIAITLCVACLMISFLSRKQQENYETKLRIAKQDAELLRRKALISRQEAELSQQAEELNHAQMSLFRSQIKPDFLFSSLMFISDAILLEPTVAIEALSALSKFLRIGIRGPESGELNTLAQEIDLVKNYLYLEERRTGIDVNLILDLDEMDIMLPSMILQNLVEDAIKVGFLHSNGNGTITISSWWEDDACYVTVADDGTNFDPEGAIAYVDEYNTIYSIRARVEQLCGGTVEAEGTPETGALVTLCIPDTVTAEASRESD